MREFLRNGVFDGLAEERLVWLPELGIGYYPVLAGTAPYDRAYWEKYREMDRTETGRALTGARVDWATQTNAGCSVLDIGIGGGRFVEECPLAFGYDVNPHAVAWLKQTGRYLNPDRYSQRPTAMSFWDSFEHIPDPTWLLSKAGKRVYMSLPIFENAEHVVHSKHFRKDEHCWYFTAPGLALFMRRYGFEMRDYCRMETDLGREDIGTFYFERVTP